MTSAIERLESVSVGTVVFVLQKGGLTRCFMNGVKAVTPSNRFVGRARTLRTVPMREDITEQRRSQPRHTDPHRVAIEEIGEGEVLVVSARGNLGAAVAGDLLAQRIKSAGGRAIVTDGCVRDVTGIREVGLPAFARGVHAGIFGTEHLAMDVNVPVDCGGILVWPGDYLVGDFEGVAVIPADMADDLAVKCLEQEKLDSFLRGKIEAGVPLARAYPPDAELQSEYRRMRDSGP